MILSGVDIETTALSPEDGELSLLQVADPERHRVDVYDALGWGELPVPGRGIERTTPCSRSGGCARPGTTCSTTTP